MMEAQPPAVHQFPVSASQQWSKHAVRSDFGKGVWTGRIASSRSHQTPSTPFEGS